MNVSSTSKKRIIWTINRVSILGNGLWMASVIAIRNLPDRISSLLFQLRRKLSPVRVVSAAVLAALVITPTTLYFHERSLHMQQKRAYRSLTLSAASEAGYLRTSIEGLMEQKVRMTELLLDAGHNVYAGDELLVKVVATGYSSSVMETDDTPFTTASNTRTRLGILALSRDLITAYTPGAPFSFGDKVHVTGLGDFIVEDSMNARWTRRADIWFPSRLEAVRFGIRETFISTSLVDIDEPDPKSVATAGGL